MKTPERNLKASIRHFKLLKVKKRNFKFEFN